MSVSTNQTQQTTEQRLRMSYADFCAFGDDTTHAEWVAGEVILFMPPNDKHQELVGFLYYLLVSFADLFALGVVRLAPYEMRLIPGQLSREPDILFVAAANRARLTAARLEGPADLVVEVVSESSASRDRVTKFREYAQAGISEYWLIDPRPDQHDVVCYQLDTAGQYQASAPDSAGRLHSRVLPGFWLRPAWLWQEPLPAPLTALLELRGLPPDALHTLRQPPDEQGE
jgi:Uma2 family endonuclease